MVRLRSLTLVLLLLGQLAAATQSFAMGTCHDMSPAPAESQASHADHAGAEEALHHEAGGDMASHGDRAAHDCTCATGMHCGHIAVLLTERAPVAEPTPQESAWRSSPARDTALAHRRDPERPPAS